jgi:hypothetical protein
MEKKYLKTTGASSSKQEIELILQKIDQLEAQDELISEKLQERIIALEKRDVFAVFETKMSPFKN